MEPKPGRTVEVLIIDDNRDAADTLAMIVQLQHHRCRVAYDPIGGLREALEAPPDCLISDIAMAGMDGYALARHVRSETSLANVKLVAHSAYSGPDHVQRAQAAGFDYLVTKGDDPAKIMEVLSMIKEIKGLASQTQELAKKNLELASETKGILKEVKKEVKEVKEEMREVKQEVRDLRKEVRDLQDDQNRDSGKPNSDGAK